MMVIILKITTIMITTVKTMIMMQSRGLQMLMTLPSLWINELSGSTH